MKNKKPLFVEPKRPWIQISNAAFNEIKEAIEKTKLLRIDESIFYDGKIVSYTVGIKNGYKNGILKRIEWKEENGSWAAKSWIRT